MNTQAVCPIEKLLREGLLATIDEGGMPWEATKVRLAMANPSPQLQAVLQMAQFHIDEALERSEMAVLNYVLYGELPKDESDED